MTRERLFGTDGVRGIPGTPPLTPDMVRGLAAAAARLVLRTRRANGAQPAVLMGRDTRGSGPGLCRSLARGFAAAGCRTIDLGVVPTPAVSYLTPRLGCLCGVIVSASHNPAEFNGIKFFMPNGLKMPESLEDEVERLVLGRREAAAPGRRPGRVPVEDGGLHAGRYLDFLRSIFPAHLDLSGMRIVADCANGAASSLAPAVLASLGAEVVRLGCSPDGRNINEGCGALDTERMRRAVLKTRSACGVSFDGDADRAIFCDERGRIADGDALIALAALRLERLGMLRGRRVVVTVMSNLGLIRFLGDAGISSTIVPVGDRNVADALEREGLSLGGEASGHIIFRCLAPTGDGLVTALETLAAVRERGGPFSAALPRYRVFPMLLKNVPVKERVPLAGLPGFQRRLAGHQARLGASGRVVVRYSGTEPLLRVMVEGPTGALVRRVAADLAAVYLKECGK